MSEALLDASALVEFFEGTERGAVVCDLIETGSAAVTLLSIAETADVFARKSRPFAEESQFIKTHIRIIPLSFTTCVAAGAFKNTRRASVSSFGLADALLYLTAQERGLTLVTKDNDFAGLDSVQLL
jgi:predicted nucleic acid-binding protein